MAELNFSPNLRLIYVDQNASSHSGNGDSDSDPSDRWGSLSYHRSPKASRRVVASWSSLELYIQMYVWRFAPDDDDLTGTRSLTRMPLSNWRTFSLSQFNVLRCQCLGTGLTVLIFF